MIPVVARNAAWVALASEFPNSDLIHSEAFIRAIDRALESAAPHMLAECWEASAKATADYELEYRVSFDFGDDLPEPPANPYRPKP